MGAHDKVMYLTGERDNKYVEWGVPAYAGHNVYSMPQGIQQQQQQMVFAI